MKDYSFILVIDRKNGHKHRIPLKVCNRISRIVMSLTTWMKKCVVSVQLWIKHVSMEGNVVGFFMGEECVGAPQQLLGLQWCWTCETSLDNCLYQLVYFVMSMFISNSLTSHKWYWLCFEWYVDWFGIGITNWNQMNDNLSGMECLLLT